MTIYEIDQKIRDLVDPETGEVLELEAFHALNMSREKKLEGMALWYKESTAIAKDIKDEIDALKQRKEAAERRAESLKRRLNEVLNGERFETARCAITFRKTSYVDISDEGALAEWAMASEHNDVLIAPPPKVSKPEVKALIKSGVEVPHAQIVERLSMGVK